MPLERVAESNDTIAFPMNGLGYAVVYVHQDAIFPPTKNSVADILLVRAANLYLRRRQNGFDDAFLFIFPSVVVVDEEAVRRYGFGSVEIRFTSQPKILADDLSGAGVIDLDAISSCPSFPSVRDEIGEMVSGWTQEKHPSALPFVDSEYDIADFWWVGMESVGRAAKDSVDVCKFASELPPRHSRKGVTWLEVARNAKVISTGHDSIDEHESSLYVAALCEWLHGYEAVSGDGDNDFSENSVMSWLPVSQFALGFEAAQTTDDNFALLCEEHECDAHDSAGVLLKLVIGSRRSQVRDSLSEYFGGDANLFFLLHSIVSPNFTRPMREQFYNILALEDAPYDELADAWQFVTDGWHDKADADYDA